MKLPLRLLLLLPFVSLFFSCKSDDTAPASTTVALRNTQEVYNEDIAEIETFMDEHFITVDGNFNTTFTKITTSTPGTPITDHPDLTFKTVTTGGVDHKLYYIKLREGVGENPTKLDSVFSIYKGQRTDLSVFDEATTPTWFQLEDVVRGWTEIFPEFKTGTAFTDNTTGITTYSDFGAGIMFVPSGLAYFNQSQVNIPSYSPIIFNFKLMKLKYRDHDGDKVLSKNEYLGTGLVSGSAVDSDSDGKPNYIDFDDDNDGKLTREEVRITNGVSSWYSFNSIPDCAGLVFGNTGFNKRRHTDSSCR